MTASTNSENIFFLKPGRGKAKDDLHCAATLNIALYIRDNISFLHAFSGCGTTSALFRQGKNKFVNVLSSTELQQVVNILRVENACQDDIDEARQKVLIALYAVAVFRTGVRGGRLVLRVSRGASKSM
ncbi:hypothetical protein AVEN_66807-1 [Araneus ventricosus]|uniref:Uncharacterized protein n=1 Tax=Araneus ventricosus TaxID=182803 RepID=A0A4Y2DNU3_ARAVE|nr:hypothetical protein AVEN_66807-1 [Araneus ventricosus]